MGDLPSEGAHPAAMGINKLQERDHLHQETIRNETDPSHPGGARGPRGDAPRARVAGAFGPRHGGNGRPGEPAGTARRRGEEGPEGVVCPAAPPKREDYSQPVTPAVSVSCAWALGTYGVVVPSPCTSPAKNIGPVA